MRKFLAAPTLLLLFSASANAQIWTPLRILNSGTILPLRYKLNFVNGGCVDDAALASTDCTFLAGTSLGNWRFVGDNADLTAAGAMGIGNIGPTATSLAFGPAAWTLSANLIATGNSSATNTTGLIFRPSVADGATSIGTVVDNGTTFSTAGAKFVSIQNNTVEQFNFQRTNPTISATVVTMFGDGVNPYISLSNGAGTFVGYSTTFLKWSGGEIDFATASTTQLSYISNELQPAVDLAFALGDTSKRYTGIFSRHFVGGGSAPTCAIGNATQLGTGPTCPTTAGNDSFHVVTVNVGTTPAAFVGGAAITVATVSFTSSYGVAPSSIVCIPTNTAAGAVQSGTLGVFFFADSASTGTGSYVIKAVDGGAGSLSNTAYKLACIVGG